MDTSIWLAVAAVFSWVAVVLVISFVAAPLTIRAPQATPMTGFGAGPLVFRTMNAFEYLFLLIVAFALFTHETPLALNVAMSVAAGALLAQTILVRPLLASRIATVLDGDDGRRLRSYYPYWALELVKVVALAWTGTVLLGA